MRKLIALLLTTSLLAGCSNTTELEAATAPNLTVENEAPVVDESQDEPTLEPTESPVNDTPGSENIGQELLEQAISSGVIACFELLGPDFTRAANGVASIKWYCLPELNVQSLEIVTATYDSLDDLETQSQMDLQTIEGLQGFTYSLLRNELTTVGIFSKDEDWESELPETLRVLWAW